MTGSHAHYQHPLQRENSKEEITVLMKNHYLCGKPPQFKVTSKYRRIYSYSSSKLTCAHWNLHGFSAGWNTSFSCFPALLQLTLGDSVYETTTNKGRNKITPRFSSSYSLHPKYPFRALVRKTHSL